MVRSARQTRDKETKMLNLKAKHVLSAAAALLVLTMVFSSVFADVTSVARTHYSGGGHNFASFVTSLGL
jgi:hypothetical protein